MRIAYVEPIGGAAGNMLLGAFADAGADLDAVESSLRTVVRDGWRLERARVDRRGIAALHVDFEIDGDDAGGATSLEAVLATIERSGLTALQRERASATYRALAAAETRVHGTSPGGEHFHECGALDAVLDVCASAVAIDLLAIERVVCAPLPIGTGEIAMHHGRYPNPPPATAELLRGIPSYGTAVAGELVTPTGAALLRTLAAGFGPQPSMIADAIGYGAGTRDGAVPNVVRVSVGVAVDEEAAEDVSHDVVRVLEANVDDMSPQFFELAVERIFAAGALDVWLTTIAMKKGRPAITLSAIAPPEREAPCARAILRETTTLGVRVRTERRYVLERRLRTVATPYGPVRVKDVAGDGSRRRALEYDDLARIARERGESIVAVARTIDAFLEEP